MMNETYDERNNHINDDTIDNSATVYPVLSKKKKSRSSRHHGSYANVPMEEVVDDDVAGGVGELSTTNQLLPLDQEQEQKEGEPAMENEREGVPPMQPAHPSFVPPIPLTSIHAFSKSLHDSVGFFKSKKKRIQTFHDMILNTTKRDRMAIRNHYFNKYQVSISRVIQRNFNGVFRQFLLYAMMSDEEILVTEIEYALKHKNINALSAVLCTLSASDLKHVTAAFNLSPHHRSKDLKQCTHSVTSCMFYKRNVNKLLMNVLDGAREHRSDGGVDLQGVETDVRALRRALPLDTKSPTLDKELLIEMFSTHRSFEHLACIAYKYECVYGQPLFAALKHAFKSTSETGYAILLILQYATDKYDLFSTFLAKCIHDRCDGYDPFLRFIVLHYDVDLKNIIDQYGPSALDSWIKLELRNNGHVETAKAMLTLCGCE